MLRLAVTTQAESFERLADHLPEYGIEVVSVEPAQRVIDLDRDPYPAVDVGYVYPSRLMEGGVLESFLDVPWVNDRRSVLRSRNKAATIRRLSAAGIPVPATTFVSNPVDREAVLDAYDRIDGPVVVKPNSASQGTGVTLARDRDALDGIVDYLDLVQDYRATGDRSFLLQAYLPEATDYRVMVLDGECVGAVERRLPEDSDGWKHNVHGDAEPVAIEPSGRLRSIAERAAAAIDAPLVGIDLLETDDGLVVTETNARPTIDHERYVEDFWDRLSAVIERTARADADRE